MLTIFIFILGILITIFLVVGTHEFGHFLMARALGIKVLRFSIGFGKILYRWLDKKGTEYVLAAIPLGGYVRLLDENEEKVLPSEAHLAFNRQPLYKRMAVIIAGPLSNLIFALIIYWSLFVHGVVSIIPLIANVQPNSIAALAGLQAHQEIVAVDHISTPNWTSVIINMLIRAGDTSPMQITAKNVSTQQTHVYSLHLDTWKIDELKPDPLDSLGIVPAPLIPSVVDVIATDSPAAKSPLKKGDKIIAIGKDAITDWVGLMTIVANHPSEKLMFTIKRQAKTLIFPVLIGVETNWLRQKHGFLGIGTSFKFPKNLLRENKYSPILAISHAWHNLVIFTQLNFICLEKMLTGKLSSKSLGGPITIFLSAGSAFNQGMIPFFSFLAFLSVSIGIINILPIPGLDGGHFLFQLIELVNRKPVSLRLQMLLYRLGIIVLLLVMVQALYNDILRL